MLSLLAAACEIADNGETDISKIKPENITKTLSDVKKCEFNSHNDAWRGRSYLARNAELALRGFEIVYSGKGGDMISPAIMLLP